MQIALFCNIAQNIRGSQMETFANDGNHCIVQQQCVDKFLCLHTFDIVGNCDKNNNNLKMILKFDKYKAYFWVLSHVQLLLPSWTSELQPE